MKVYIVWHTVNVGEYEDEVTSLVKIFKSRKKALGYILNEIVNLPGNTETISINQSINVYQYKLNHTTYEYTIEEYTIE